MTTSLERLLSNSAQASSSEPPRSDPIQRLMSGDNEYSAQEAGPIARQYPRLAPYLKNLVVKEGQTTVPGDDRQLEFYQPWERDNPAPGKLTTEIFNKNLTGEDRHQAIAGDILHHLGAIDPTGKPVDAQWMSMKKRLIDARDPSHIQMDEGAYKQEQQSPYGAGSPEDWMQNNRSDAYIRAGLFPQQNPDWQRPGMFTPQMQAIFGEMKNYLKGGQ